MGGKGVLKRVEKLIKPPRNGPFKLDLGCANNKNPDGFRGVDIIAFEGVDYVFDLTQRWPLPDKCVDEVFSSHTLEHFDGYERAYFCNELWRVLKDDGKAVIVVPHWSSGRAFGDPTHKWPPMAEFFWYYLDRDWRRKEAAHTDREFVEWGFDCNFETTWVYGMAPCILQRAQDYQTYAVNHLRETIYDMHATLIKKKPAQT